MSSSAVFIPSKSPDALFAGDTSLSAGHEMVAIKHYLYALNSTPQLKDVIGRKVALARRRYRQRRMTTDRLNVAVCGRQLGNNSAGRVYTLAQIYSAFADTAIVGCLFSSRNGGIWEPIRDTVLPVHYIVAENSQRFIEQALELVLEHPCDVVHLCKPRLPSIIFGVLYKLVWQAHVLMDIDDEELTIVDAPHPITVDEYVQHHGRLPEMQTLHDRTWTQIAVSLAGAFDGITVSNHTLQARYGGVIIPHARDEQKFCPSLERKIRSRARFNIDPDQFVVLFCGTPRRHKGILETATALASLNRSNITYVIVGDFTERNLKKHLQEISNVSFCFIGNQPYDSIADVVAMGDVTILLQDSDSPISHFQVPAKLSDALGMGVVALVSDLHPVADMVADGAVIPVTRKTLKTNLERLLQSEEDLQVAAQAGRRFFLQHLSFSANLPPLKAIALPPAGLPPVNRTVCPELRRLLMEHEAWENLRCLLGSDTPDAAHGVSVILTKTDDADQLDDLLSTFFYVNTHHPVEIIVCYNAAAVTISEVIKKHSIKGFIRHCHFAFNSYQCAIRKARHPYLLFVNETVRFTDDVLSAMLAGLADTRVGVVSVRLDKVSEGCGESHTPSIFCTGVRFIWNTEQGRFQTGDMHNAIIQDESSPSPVHARTLHTVKPYALNFTPQVFMCRRADITSLTGSENHNDSNIMPAAAELSMRFKTELHMEYLCLMDLSLQLR